MSNRKPSEEGGRGRHRRPQSRPRPPPRGPAKAAAARGRDAAAARASRSGLPRRSTRGSLIAAGGAALVAFVVYALTVSRRCRWG